jgi:effector-binding domain-containing protein/uncharacterized protein YndB with AHSA1/START domain
MNRYWRWLGGGLLLAALIGMLLPSGAVVRRDIVVDAQRATVFALIDNPLRFMEWSPRTEADPNARLEFSGPPRGVGATVSWQGRVIGRGRQTIVDSKPYERVVFRIDTSGGPYTRSTFELADGDGGTHVVWTWERDYGMNLAARYFALTQDNIHGPGLEKDLARLGEIATRLPRADFSDLEVENIVVRAEDIAYIRTSSAPESAALSEAMSDAFFDIIGFIDRHGLRESGAPMSITRTFSGSSLVFDAAIPIRGLHDGVPRTENAVKIGRTYAGPVIRVRHTGAYASLERTHDKIAAYLAAMGIDRNGDTWESYVSDPGRTDESGLTTFIYYPVRN